MKDSEYLYLYAILFFFYRLFRLQSLNELRNSDKGKKIIWKPTPPPKYIPPDILFSKYILLCPLNLKTWTCLTYLNSYVKEDLSYSSIHQKEIWAYFLSVNGHRKKTRCEWPLQLQGALPAADSPVLRASCAHHPTQHRSAPLSDDSSRFSPF